MHYVRFVFLRRITSHCRHLAVEWRPAFHFHFLLPLCARGGRKKSEFHRMPKVLSGIFSGRLLLIQLFSFFRFFFVLVFGFLRFFKCLTNANAKMKYVRSRKMGTRCCDPKIRLHGEFKGKKNNTCHV